VYQLGRGSEPVIVVGNIISFVPRYISVPPKTFWYQILSYQEFSQASTAADRL